MSPDGVCIRLSHYRCSRFCRRGEGDFLLRRRLATGSYLTFRAASTLSRQGRKRSGDRGHSFEGKACCVQLRLSRRRQLHPIGARRSWTASRERSNIRNAGSSNSS